MLMIMQLQTLIRKQAELQGYHRDVRLLSILTARQIWGLPDLKRMVNCSPGGQCTQWRHDPASGVPQVAQKCCKGNREKRLAPKNGKKATKEIQQES